MEYLGSESVDLPSTVVQHPKASMSQSSIQKGCSSFSLAHVTVGCAKGSRRLRLCYAMLHYGVAIGGCSGTIGLVARW